MHALTLIHMHAAAQVRAAMPGMPVSEQNCHPFQFGRYMWMHNGMV